MPAAPKRHHDQSGKWPRALCIPARKSGRSAFGIPCGTSSLFRGCRARLRPAHRRFAGLIVKNPVHKHWRVEWRRDRPYTLGELEDWLWPRDTEPDHCISELRGAGRNCTIFEELRQVAYREVREFKRGAGDPGVFRARLERVALGINLQFPEALQLSEVRAIARSVAKWTWGRFSLEGFSDRQARLSKIANDKRWAGHVAVFQNYAVADLEGLKGNLLSAKSFCANAFAIHAITASDSLKPCWDIEGHDDRESRRAVSARIRIRANFDGCRRWAERCLLLRPQLWRLWRYQDGRSLEMLEDFKKDHVA